MYEFLAYSKFLDLEFSLPCMSSSDDLGDLNTFLTIPGFNSLYKPNKNVGQYSISSDSITLI